MMSLFKSVLRIMVLVLVGIELIGCFCINSLMFHPVRQYDAGHPGYVNIGTNGVKIAAFAAAGCLAPGCRLLSGRYAAESEAVRREALRLVAVFVGYSISKGV